MSNRRIWVIVITILFTGIVLGSYEEFVSRGQELKTKNVPGAYRAEGVWGKSTLILNSNHTFKQDAHFVNPYSGKLEGDQTTIGTWRQEDKDESSSNVVLSSFVSLAQADHITVSNFRGKYSADGYKRRIDIDMGAGVYYLSD